MYPFSLKYIDSHLEQKYTIETANEKLNKLLPFIVVMNSSVVIFQIYFFIVNPSQWNSYLKFALGLVLIVFISYLKKIASSILLYILWLNFVGLVVLYIELISEFQKLGDENALVLMLPFQILNSFLIFSKTRWVYCSSFFLVALIYLFFRVIDTNHDEYYVIVIMNFPAFWLIFSFLAYHEEKNFKAYFKLKEDSYEKANYFKLILQNVIPSPIFIVDYGNSQIKFTNNAGMNILKFHKPKLNFEEESYETFESFVNKLSLLREIDLLESKQETPSLINLLKTYYNNPMKQPFKADMINSKDLENNFEKFNAVISEAISSTSELIHSSNGLDETHRNYFGIKIMKVYWEDSICLLIIFNDNTNVFKISELMNLDTYKNQLLASVSHDLRTPLNGLNGMLELAIEKTVDPNIHGFLNLAKKSASFLNYLINDMIDFSLMNFKKLRLNLEIVDFKEIIEQMQSLIEFQALDKMISYRCSCKLSEFRPIISDPIRIKQILLNLLSNALKFTHQGYIELLIEDCSLDLKTSPLFKFSVKDSGIGIKPEDLNKLFHLFGRLENPEKVRKTGIGLGLTISKKISSLLCPEKPQGLQVESEFGKGTTFYFYVSSLQPKQMMTEEVKTANIYDKNEDFDRIEENKHAIYFKKNFHFHALNEFDKLLSQSSENSPLGLKGKKVLVVDDDLLSLMIAEEYLKLFNISSKRALNGLEAYKIIKNDIKSKNQQICLILMDCNMPILDGFQASLKIYKRLKKYGVKKIPILAMTANVTIENMKLCQEAGMDFFLAKPVKKEDLKAMIEKIINVSLNDERDFCLK